MASNGLRKSLVRPAVTLGCLRLRSAPQTRLASTVADPIAKPLTRKVKWIEDYKKDFPDVRWIERLDPISRARSECKDSFVAWLVPEGSVFVICTVFVISMAAVFLFFKTFVYDPEIASEVVNRGWFGKAYRGVDPTNGFHGVEDIVVPFRWPKLFPLNQAWLYSKAHRDAEAAEERWHEAKKKWWNELERPRLVAQLEAMERELKTQQEQEAATPADENESAAQI